MERLLEKSLDDQYAMERARKAVEDRLNRRLLWVMLPLGIAIAVVALYMDISTRIAIPVLKELQGQVREPGGRADYAVFHLDIGAFARLAPAAIIAGALAIWGSVWAGTYYRRSFIASMYALIGLGYSLMLTALLSLLIPLNMFILKATGLSITDAEIPRSSELSFFSRDIAALSPFSYVVTGMERGLWAGAAVVVLALIGMRLAGGIGSVLGGIRAMALNMVLAAIVLAALLSGPLGFQQFLFDRFVQPPSISILKFTPAIEAIP
ncbi:MAG: hypothetical protein V3T49_01355 [Dehalococcoidia bacterium]